MNSIFVNIFVCFFLIMLHYFGKFFSHFYMTIIMIFRHILLWFKFLFFVLYKQRQFIDNLYSNSHHYVLILFALVIETIFQMHDSANFCLCNHQQNYSLRTLWIVFSVSLFNLFLAVFSKKYLRSLIEFFFFSFILVYEEINFWYSFWIFPNLSWFNAIAYWKHLSLLFFVHYSFFTFYPMRRIWCMCDPPQFKLILWHL